MMHFIQNMYILFGVMIMNIEEIETLETKVNNLSETVEKLKALVSDMKICSSDITKTLIISAIKKYSESVSNFKID